MSRAYRGASSPVVGRDESRLVALLETLRGCEPAIDVELAVSRRVRHLPVPRLFMPRVSLRQFGWAAFLGTAIAALGSLGAAALVGPAAYDLSGWVGRAASTSFVTLLRLVLARAVALAEHLPYQTLSKLALGVASEAAVAVCLAMLALSFLVLAREAVGGRRTAG